MNIPSAAARTLGSPWLNCSATIAKIKPETPGVATYDFVIDDESVRNSFKSRPGQFNMIYLPGVGEAAISISGADDPVVHTVREAGNVTRSLARLNVGDSVGLRGPFGSSWPIEECAGKDVILVAGGIGMAPLRPVICELVANRQRYGNVTLLIGARTPAGRLYAEEAAEWSARIDVQQTVDRAGSNWNGHVGVVTALLQRMRLDSPDNTVLMTCGPEVMMWYTVRTALSRGIPAQALWVSLERNMNCAIGLCGHCQLGSHFLCKDGPVLRYDRVASTMKVEGL